MHYVVAHVGAGFSITRRVTADIGVGGGMFLLSGVGKQGAIFLEPDAMGNGPLVSFAARLSAGFEVAITEHLFVTAHPAMLSLSPGHRDLRRSSAVCSSIASWSALLSGSLNFALISR